MEIQTYVEFMVAPPNYCPIYLKTIDMLVEGSGAYRRYLGYYNELFDDEGEQHLSTWLALAWILEDYRDGSGRFCVKID